VQFSSLSKSKNSLVGRLYASFVLFVVGLVGLFVETKCCYFSTTKSTKLTQERTKRFFQSWGIQPARFQISLGSVMYPVMALAPAVAGEQR
jgi:cytoskeletal protein RodZ